MKCFFFGKENRYGMEGYHEFFWLKIPKIEGTRLRTAKMEGITVRNSKNEGDHS